jgi:type IV secretion system protein TrbL
MLPQGISSIGGPPSGCAWYNLGCKGAETAANAGMSALTESIARGAQTLMGELVKNLDQSAQVPLADPTYRDVYFGFLGLAAPVIGVVLFVAVLISSLRRDAATLGRAVVGVGIAGIGGAFYIVFAQLLVGVDNWLSHGVVEVTGYDFAKAIERLGVGFGAVAGSAGEFAANMLLILLMMIMLVAALVLWFVMVLRKVAILVVVAFAPLLIAGYLWTPTRRWVTRLTEVLIALVFTKTAIYALFGVGLALLSRSGQSLSDFVAATVLMCGACFTPLLMLRLVHFAADTQLAGDAMATLRGGAAPVTGRLSAVGGGLGRHEMARSQGQAPAPQGSKPLGIDDPAGSALSGTPGAGTGGGTATGGAGASGGGASGGAAAGGAAAAGAVTAGAVVASQAAQAGASHAVGTADQLHASTGQGPSSPPDPTTVRRGPSAAPHDNP